VTQLAKDKGGMAMQTGSAVIGPTSWVDLVGMTSTVYADGIGKATGTVANIHGVYSDGYTLTSTLKFVADNTLATGTVSVCYGMIAATATSKAAWCHMLTTAGTAVDLPANSHGVKFATDTVMKTVKAGASGTGVVPSAYVWPDVSA